MITKLRAVTALLCVSALAHAEPIEGGTVAQKADRNFISSWVGTGDSAIHVKVDATWQWRGDFSHAYRLDWINAKSNQPEAMGSRSAGPAAVSMQSGEYTITITTDGAWKVDIYTYKNEGDLVVTKP